MRTVNIFWLSSLRFLVEDQTRFSHRAIAEKYLLSQTANLLALNLLAPILQI